MKNVVVTGAGMGIGYYFIRELLREGYHVMVLDLRTEGLDALKKEFASLATQTCDVRSFEEVLVGVRTCIDSFGSVDIAVHNACLCTFEPMESTEDAVYRDVFDVNYFGALNLTRAVVPYMKKQGGGKIVFSSSGVGVMGFVNISPYASSKGAIEALAKCMNIEHVNDNITFHLFHPPLTRTKSSEPLPVPKEFMANPEKVGTGLAKRIGKTSYIICHSAGQRFQTALSYLMPVRMGRLMSKMTASYSKENEKSQQLENKA